MGKREGREGKARYGKARYGKARQGKARQGKARQGKARQGSAHPYSLTLHASNARSISCRCSRRLLVQVKGGERGSPPDLSCAKFSSTWGGAARSRSASVYIVKNQ